MQAVCRRTIVVDASNEIAGDGLIPNECIGRSRRISVPRRRVQADVALEALQNHSPEVHTCFWNAVACTGATPFVIQ